ncbi:MAG TPA: TIR domain-containing protein, partial [Terracidiphilus sp.]|nr:TIR domain-containing protein [Terracidiphilus sp.]
MAHDVFISHSAKDKVTADAVCAMLESEGIRCWIAPRDVLPSMEWGEAIIDAIEQCRIMVLVFTANANASPQIRREVERAVNHGVAILPLRIENVLPAKALEYFIGNVHWLDALTPPIEAHLKSLAGTIKILLARTGPGAVPGPAEEGKALTGLEHRPDGEAEHKAGARESGTAPRRFWSARAWTWAAGTVSVLLLGLVFVGVHSTWVGQPAPVGSPGAPQQPGAAPNPGSTQPPLGEPTGPISPLTPGVARNTKPTSTGPGGAGNNASLKAAMNSFQSGLGSIGTVSFTVFTKNTANGSAGQYTEVHRVTNVVADPAHCRVSWHVTDWQNGAAKPVMDKDAWVMLHDVTSVVVEPQSQFLTENNAA